MFPLAVLLALFRLSLLEYQFMLALHSRTDGLGWIPSEGELNHLLTEHIIEQQGQQYFLTERGQTIVEVIQAVKLKEAA